MSEADRQPVARPTGRRRPVALLAVAAALLVAIGVLGGWLAARDSGGLAARHGVVEARGAQVMPFDQNRTTHVFTATIDGGVQSVTANDASDTTQIRLIREHLRSEADRFASGDFSDPAAIHGMQMPGLAQLRAGARRIVVRYTELPDGGRITYTANDPSLITALHDWFDAQLMDHGAHAHG